MSQEVAPFRLAFRLQDEWYVAYMAHWHTLDGAMELARIRVGLLEAAHARDTWIELIQIMFAAHSESCGVPLGFSGTMPSTDGQEKQ